MKPKSLVKSMTFETAMSALRRGKLIRRRGWHAHSHIFRLGADVFVKLPNNLIRHPQVWAPYPQDFLATDWEQVR